MEPTQTQSPQDSRSGQYEPPAITDLGSLMQITAGTGTRRNQDAGGASV